jgi:thymidylate kinase
MIFEFAGVDGSGKSTLIGAVRRRINEGGRAFAYERSFQSEGVRLLEAVASAEERKRPVGVFGRDIVEHVRCVDLVRRSFDLHPYAGSTSQHVLTDSYIIEQLGRLIQFGCCSDAAVALVHKAIQPELTFYLKLPALKAVDRMRGRAKGDALLLSNDPLAETHSVIHGIEQALLRAVVPVVELDASQSVEALSDDVWRHIERVVHSDGTGAAA